MRDLFILWVTVQLMLIGFAGVSITNQVIEKKFDCKQTITPAVWGVLIPLAVFVPNDGMTDKYCGR